MHHTLPELPFAKNALEPYTRQPKHWNITTTNIIRLM